MHRITPFLAAITSLLLAGGAANAAVISVNFGNSDTDTGNRGVVSAGNWTLLKFDDLSNNTATLTDLVDGSGAATTADLGWTSGNARPGLTLTDGTLDENMIVTGITLKNESTPVTLNLSQIPYAQYDIYVYVTDTNSTETQPVSVSDGTTTFHLTTPTDNLTFFQDNGFVQSTSIVATATNANYVRFSGLTGTSQSIALLGDEIGPAGIQIVEVPEPASLALVGLGSLLILGGRRQSV